MSKTKKLLIAAVCLVAILTTAVVGTIAWLTDKTATVTNTFSPSNIDITLTEGAFNGKMVPGVKIAKNPVVTVKANSEACWLFVKIDENLGAWTANGEPFTNYLAYSVITGTDGWTKLSDGIYYRQVAASTADQSFNILGAGTLKLNDVVYSWDANQVLVRPDVTKADMDKLYVAGAVQPTLSFTAYAIQQESFGTAAAAWAEIETSYPTQNS